MCLQMLGFRAGAPSLSIMLDQYVVKTLLPNALPCYCQQSGPGFASQLVIATQLFEICTSCAGGSLLPVAAKVSGVTIGLAS